MNHSPYTRKEAEEMAREYVSSHEDSEVRRMYGHHLRTWIAGRMSLADKCREMEELIFDMSFHLANTTQLVARAIDMEYNEGIGHYENYKKAESEIKGIVDRSNKLVEKAKALNHKDNE